MSGKSPWDVGWVDKDASDNDGRIGFDDLLFVAWEHKTTVFGYRVALNLFRQLSEKQKHHKRRGEFVASWLEHCISAIDETQSKEHGEEWVGHPS